MQSKTFLPSWFYLSLRKEKILHLSISDLSSCRNNQLYSTVLLREKWNISKIQKMKNFSKFQFYLVVHTGNMRQLVVVRRICCCSQFMIFPLQLLGPAIGFSADPSSSKGKNHELRTTTNSSNYN